MKTKKRVANLLFLSTMMACNASVKTPTDAEDSIQKEVQRTVEQIQQVECPKTDSVLIAEGLKDEDIVKVRVFCAMSTEEMSADISVRFQEASVTGTGNYKTNQQFYGCYGEYSNIPNYADLGLTASNCSWHDNNPVGCRVEGTIVCLWGCTNVDPVLGWHMKWYASALAVQADIYSLGYSRRLQEPGISYRRYVGNGYSYQVHAMGDTVVAGGTGYYHTEGPEPETNFNWHGYLGRWWPFLSESWHQQC